MGWWGVVWRISVIVGVIAAFLTLPAFRSQRDAIARLLTIYPLDWFDRAGQSTSVHGVVRTGSDTVFSQAELRMYDGSDSSRGIYLAVLGSVYDVSAGRRHYGPDGSYGFFSGLLSHCFLFISLLSFVEHQLYSVTRNMLRVFVKVVLRNCCSEISCRLDAFWQQN